MISQYREAKTVKKKSKLPLLTTGGEDHALLVWQGLSGNVLLRIHGHEGPIYDVAWSPDVRRIASCRGSGRKGELFVWDAMLGTRVRVLEGHSSPIFSVVGSSDGTQLVGGVTDGALHWWDLDQGVSPETVQALMVRWWQSHTTGLSEVQRVTLRSLGAVE